jgi:hypothetical protein
MIEIPRHMWIEMHHNDANETDSCDVIVEMDSGKIYNALFITLPYLQRQMQLSYTVGKQLPDTPPIRYAVLETPHVVVDNLERDTIEDTIDNLLALDVFGGVFTLVTEHDDDSPTQTLTTGKRATTEVAAVVISDVLVVDG